MNKIKFDGVHSAIFSVYDKEMNVIKDTVNKMVEYQLNGGLKGFYVGGNTGECLTLPTKTRKQMLETVVDANNGRGLIMAHVGAGHLCEVLELLDHANNQKIDAVASLPPSLQKYYNAEEIIEFYKMLADKSKYPVYAYVTPVLNCDLTWFAEQVAKIDNIAGIKISIPDYYSFGKITRINGGSLNVLNGPDETMICGLSRGADGAIGTTYNIVPKLAVEVYNAFKSGNMELARQKQDQLNSVIDIFIGHNIGYWKAGLSVMGFDMGYTVAPAKPVTTEDLEVIKTKLNALGLLNNI